MTTNLLQFKLYIYTLYRTLLLSITSIDFYKDVRIKYKGYGIKYIFTLSLLASILSSVKFITNLSYIEESLLHKNNSYFEHMLRQLPEIKYDGKIISTEVETPYFITDSASRKIIAIDTEGKLSFNQRSKIPVILTKTNITFLIYYNGDKSDEFSVSYKNLLGNESFVITESFFREYMIKTIKKNNYIWIYTLPIMCVIYLIKVLVKSTMPILLLYFLSNLYNVKLTTQDSCRLVMFSSGVFLLSNSILNLLFPSMILISEIIHVISAYLLVMSIIRK